MHNYPKAAKQLLTRLEGSTVGRKAITRTLKDTLRIAYKNYAVRAYKTTKHDQVKEVWHTQHQLVLSY